MSIDGINGTRYSVSRRGFVDDSVCFLGVDISIIDRHTMITQHLDILFKRLMRSGCMCGVRERSKKRGRTAQHSPKVSLRKKKNKRESQTNTLTAKHVSQINHKIQSKNQSFICPYSFTLAHQHQNKIIIQPHMSDIGNILSRGIKYRDLYFNAGIVFRHEPI